MIPESFLSFAQSPLKGMLLVLHSVPHYGITRLTLERWVGGLNDNEKG